MTLQELRILPPLSFARLGSADEPVDNFTIDYDPSGALDYRVIVPSETLVVDEDSGEIRESRVPEEVTFKKKGRVRPVAPFLEVFVRTADDVLEPLTLDLLAQNGIELGSLEWRVVVANRKVVRRTNDPDDLVHADTGWFSCHGIQRLDGHSANFVSPDAKVDFGSVRFIKPTQEHPEIRLRFTPAKGDIYGPDVPSAPPEPGEYVVPPERCIYDSKKGTWSGFELDIPADGVPSGDGPFQNETLPPSLYAIVPPAPSWLHDNVAVSRGYFDDACDGFVEVAMTRADGERLVATARISSGPPALVPDSLFVRSLADDLDQALLGPVVEDEDPQVTRDRAEEIVRRAFETVRSMNVTVMNGNDIDGRSALSLDTMPAEEAFDTSRLMRPVMATDAVDTLAVMALHQQVFAALRGGAPPWFLHLLRRPEEAADYTDRGRRKMPALMCGADNNYLALTHRQIDTFRRTAETALFAEPFDVSGDDAAHYVAPVPAPLTPRNLSAQLHYAAKGNPISSRPVVAIGNCCPGLEVDFRAVWRRLLAGIVLREYDNLVVETDPDVVDERIKQLAGHRLLRIDGVPVIGEMRGPSPASVKEEYTVLYSEANPKGVAPLEWSNALAHVLHESRGKKVKCDFTAEQSWYVQQPWDDDPATYVTVELEVRDLFEEGSALISRTLAQEGELTQGLCSPWQNDYRECSCYYWASARPDYVNVEPASGEGSKGDNWLQKVRTGRYIPDDYVDTRLVHYEDLFADWEYWLRYQIRGKDAPGEGDGRK